LIDAIALSEGVDPALVHAVISQESAYHPTAVSRAGAAGLMQLMPATAARFGLTPEERFDPERNVRAGIRYLRWLLARFDGDLELALAGYNAGEGAVLKYGRQIPPFEETQDYVRRVARHRARYAAAEGAGTL
jgi:soluble lytic murein transglycosylase-like protein